MKIILRSIFLLFLMVGVCFSQGTKITDYTELATKPAPGDYFITVDVSDPTMAATGTNKKIRYDTMTKGMPWDFNWAIYSPSTSMINISTAKIQRAITLSSVGCLVDPDDTGESVLVSIYKCNSNGDNCSQIISQVTCGNTATVATITDSSLAAGAIMRINILSVTGTVTSLLIYGTGTQDF